MVPSKNKDSNKQSFLKRYFKSKTFQRLLIGIITLLIAFVIIETGAAPKKYKLSLNEKSSFDIAAPWDIENKVMTDKKAREEADKFDPIMIKVDTAGIDVYNDIDSFTSAVESYKKNADSQLKAHGIYSVNSENNEQAEKIFKNESGSFYKENNFGAKLTYDQAYYLIVKSGNDDLKEFEDVLKDLVKGIMSEDITEKNLADKVYEVQNRLEARAINKELKDIGVVVMSSILKPNRKIDQIQTEEKKDQIYKDYKENQKVMINKGDRIISKGDIVSEDKLQVLSNLNLLETGRKFDYGLAAGIFIILFMLTFILIIYMNHFCKKVLYHRNDLLLLSLIILMTLVIARVAYAYFSALAIPVFVAVMLISILLDLKLSAVVNFTLTLSISFITKEDSMIFIYMSLISGTVSAFLAAKATQRNRLFMTGLIIGVLNVLIIVCFGIINKNDIQIIAENGLIVFFNGVFSIVLTIGILPLWESVFNILTPLKLLELANPNQPLIKRLLMEAPGTYHHSLMVGNLAGVATEAIGGNPLLARIGAYFHDIGKLKRPNFFKENQQFAENPHDRMTANLSTLVITSHTHDGVQIAEEYKIPLAIRDIIKQHHGTTLVAYFYHKAKKGDNSESINHENFRYSGPKPTTKEAAVVMLADSVEAAVRSMIDKTEGKMEGVVRKIIKDKLDDGQLDLCNLTLKDLDNIAKSFIRVLSGFFHERNVYPEVEVKKNNECEKKPEKSVEAGAIKRDKEAELTVREGIKANVNNN